MLMKIFGVMLPSLMPITPMSLIINIIFIAFWIWILIDSISRNFKNKNEKIAWILIIVLTGWIGAVVYLFAIKVLNPSGISRHKN